MLSDDATSTANNATRIDLLETGGTPAGKAKALNNSTAIGSSSIPVYFTADGKPTAITAIDNERHYTPEASAYSDLHASNDTEAAMWGTTGLITSLILSRDSKGHVTDLSATYAKMPAKPATEKDYEFESWTFTILNDDGSEEEVPLDIAVKKNTSTT